MSAMESQNQEDKTGLKPEDIVLEKFLQDRGVDIFLCLLEQPSSASDLSQRLGITRAKVNYILDCFLQREMISLHSERRNGMSIEKCYSAKEETFHLLAGNQASDSEKLKAMMYILDVMKRCMLESMHRKMSMHLGMVHVKVSPGRLKEYTERVKALQQEFDMESADPEQMEEGQWHTMVLSLFPGPHIQ